MPGPALAHDDDGDDGGDDGDDDVVVCMT
jgi:hypothetical protein